jgi:hypothetical protein
MYYSQWFRQSGSILGKETEMAINKKFYSYTYKVTYSDGEQEYTSIVFTENEMNNGIPLKWNNNKLKQSDVYNCVIIKIAELEELVQ